MIFSALKAGIKAARAESKRKRAEKIAPSVRLAVIEYLETCPEPKAAAIIGRIVGAAGLTDASFQRLFKASGDKVIDIHFANGDTATISNRTQSVQGGPGW